MLPLHSLVHAPFSSFASTSTCALPLLIHKAEFPPFFTQPQKPRRDDRETEEAEGKGKRKQSMKDGKEEDVDDREWEMRVGCGILHLRDILPEILNPPKGKQLFPPNVYSSHVTLSLPPPLPLNISSLALYSLTFNLARHGMHALHSDLHVELERLTVSQTPTTPVLPFGLTKKRSQLDRYRQVRVLLTVHGTPRLPPHHPTTWQTSSLFTFSPLSGLIKEHKVETIRPLPGETAAEWLTTRLWGWRAADIEALGLPARAGVVGREMEKEAALLRCQEGK